MLVTGTILGLYYTGTDNIVYSRCQFFVISLLRWNKDDDGCYYFVQTEKTGQIQTLFITLSKRSIVHLKILFAWYNVENSGAPKHSSRIHWTDQTTNLETDTANLYKTGLTSQYRSISIKLDTNFTDWSNLGYVHTLPDSSFCAGTKIIPDIGLLFTHKNGCGARFQWRSDAAPRGFRKWSVLYRTGFVPYLGAVWTPVLSPSRK